MSAPDAPVGFVDWIGVTKTLQHAATGGVRTIMLLQLDGSVLSIAHAASSTTGILPSESLLPSAQLKKLTGDSVTGALVASIWHDHNAFGSSQDLQSLILDCENGQIIVSKISNFLLSIVANHTIQPGMLRGKMMTLLHSLQDLYKLQHETQ